MFSITVYMRNSVAKVSLMFVQYFEYYAIILRRVRFFVDTLYYLIPCQGSLKTVWIRSDIKKQPLILECWPMPNVMAAQPKTGGVLCESSVIPFLVPRQKVWPTAAARVPCSNAANIGECKTWTQSEFCSWQNSVRGNSPPQKCIYSIPLEDTAKHRAKFGWPPLSDVAAVTKPRRETR